MTKQAPAWELAFLKALEHSGIASAAARVAGTGVRNAFKRRKANATFAAAWDAAVALHRSEAGRQALQAVAAEGVAFNSAPDGGKLLRAGQSRWSKRAEETFLTELTVSGNVRRAAAAGFSTTAVYKQRLKSRHFAAAWDAAIETGKARVQAFLVEAAGRTFDPDALPIGDERELPKVSISEAINIAKLPGRPSTSPGSGPGLWRTNGAEPPSAAGQPRGASDEEVSKALVKSLKAFGVRTREAYEKAGWVAHELPAPPGIHGRETERVWLPPDWRLVRAGEE